MNKSNWNIRKAVMDDAKSLKDCMDMAYSKYLSRLNEKKSSTYGS